MTDETPESTTMATPDTTEPFAIQGGMLVAYVGHHTCGTGPEGHYGLHEPGCGWEPVLPLDQLDEVLHAGMALTLCIDCGHRHEDQCQRKIVAMSEDGPDETWCGCEAPVEHYEPFTGSSADPWFTPAPPHHQSGCPEVYAVTPGRDTCTCPRPRPDEPPF